MDMLASFPTDVIVLASWPRDISTWSSVMFEQLQSLDLRIDV